jgi:hypothetical protein
MCPVGSLEEKLAETQLARDILRKSPSLAVIHQEEVQS